MGLRTIQILISVSFFNGSIFGSHYLNVENKANCLGQFCDLDPSLVNNFKLSVGCKDTKPCVEAQWSASPQFDSSLRIRYKLEYRIVWPKSLRNNYSTHELFDTSFTLDTLNRPAHGVIYEFRIYKQFKGKYGIPTIRNVSMPESVPTDSPKNLKIIEIGDNSLEVTWDAPNPNDNYGIIVMYQVRYYVEDEEERTERMVNVSDKRVILTNLLYSKYKIFVRAFSRAGAGIWSNPSFYYKPIIVQNLPVPINVKLYRKSSTELEVIWSLPNSSENDKKSLAIAGYIIFYSIISSTPKWLKQSIEPTYLNTIIKSLQSSALYQVKVAAVNVQGLEGHFSEIVKEHTQRVPGQNFLIVEKLRCSLTRSRMLGVEWTFPTISNNIKKFEVVYSAILSYISVMNLNKSENIDEIFKNVDARINVEKYQIKLERLQPNAHYSISVCPIYFYKGIEYNCQSSLKIICSTKPALPDVINSPVPLNIVDDKILVKVKLFRCSERNGPLSNYTVVVGALKTYKGVPLTLLKDPGEYTFMELGVNTKRMEYTGPYIAISRHVNALFTEKGKNSTEIHLGNEFDNYDKSIRAINKRLDSNVYYKAFMRVCFEELENPQCKSSNWSSPFNIIETMSKMTVIRAPKKTLNGKNGYLSYTIILVALLMCGVTLAIACIIVGCVIKRRKWKKRLVNIGANSYRDSIRSSVLVKSSLSNGIWTQEKSPLKSDIETIKNVSKRYTVAPDVVTGDSVLMCQDGSKLSPVSFHDAKRNHTHSQRPERSSKDIPEKAPTPITGLYQYISDLKADNGALLQSEFETLNTNLDDRFSWQRSNIDSNKSKNRYANVVAYDHTSVLLNPLEDVIGSDYINANYIDGYQKKNAYIATQGPLPDTTDDFWRMVWEQNSTSIVMMTRLEERSGIKCHQYWPNRGFICYGQMIVCHVESFSFSYYTIRVFELRCNKSQDKREIHHFQFTAWPDHGVPKLSTPLLMFIRRYRSMVKSDSGSTIVHCSAGVGRTGAFIVIEAQLERIKHEKTINVFNYVSKIRCQRNYMVQTQAQYLFILETLLEAVEDGNTEVIACNLHAHVSKLSQIGLSGANELSGFELEFSKLNSLASNRDRHGVMLADFVKAAGNQPVNLTKNKIRNIIPYDWNRVVLPAIRGIEGSDYINASYIDGYRDRRAYIAAQSPLPSSVEDFWRMIWDQHCGVVVVLNQPQEEKCHIYWPSHKSIRYQFFVVDPVVEYNMPNYILREFKVTDARDGEFRTLRQFQFTQWPSHGCPKESDSILDFIRQVHKTKEQFGHMEPMVVHCSTGSGRTGVFISLSIVIDRLQQESVVDMYQTVKLLHKQRLGLVQTEEQYEFVYKAVMDYLSYYEKNDKGSLY